MILQYCITLFRDRFGSIATEFALVIPLLAFVLLSVVEIQQALTVKRRVARVCETVTDIAIEEDRIGQTEIDMLRDVVAALSFGLDNDRFDITLASAGNANWEIDLTGPGSSASGPSNGAKGKGNKKGKKSKKANRRSTESLIEASCVYAHEPIFLTLFNAEIEFESSQVAAPKQNDQLDLN